MHPLCIGPDVDGVLADYMSGIAAVGRTLGHVMECTDCGPTQYSLVEPGWFPNADSAASAMNALSKAGGLGDLALLDHSAPEAVRQLRAAGHRVVIVTARHAGAYRVTDAWLRRHRIESDDLRFESFKSIVGCDIYLDDAPHNVTELREAGHVTVTYDVPYNRHIGGPRVSHLAEFAQRLLDSALDPGEVSWW